MQGAADCPACGGVLAGWRSVAASEPELRGRRFELRRCVACGTAVTGGAPLPAPHDSGAYGGGVPRLYRLSRPILNAFDRQRLALLRSLAPPPARLLDAGSGRGRFVLAAHHAGYEACGIEPSARGVTASADLGIPVHRATIETARVDPGSIGVVTLWHVLEHLDDPGSALGQIRSWLAPDGVLLLGVPNLASLQAQLSGERWFHLDVPRHRVHFTPAGIQAILAARGFQLVRTHHLLLEHNPYGMWQSLLNRITRNPSYLYNLLKRNAPLRSSDLPLTAAGMALAPAAAALEALAGRRRRGGTIAVLARRAG